MPTTGPVLQNCHPRKFAPGYRRCSVSHHQIDTPVNRFEGGYKAFAPISDKAAHPSLGTGLTAPLPKPSPV